MRALSFLFLLLLGCQSAFAIDVGWTDETDPQIDIGDVAIEGQFQGVQVRTEAGGAGAYAADSISVYAKESATTNAHNMQCGIYTTGGNLIANGVTECAADMTLSYAWQTLNFADPKPVLDGDTEYVIMCGVNNANGTVHVRGGNSFGNCQTPPLNTSCDLKRNNSPSTRPCAGLDATVSFGTGSSRTSAHYMTYSAAAGGVSTILLRRGRGR